MTVHVKWRGTNEPVVGVEVACRPVGDPMPRTKIGQRRITDETGTAVFRGLGGQSLPKPGFTVAANIGLGEITAEDVELVATLTDARGRVLAEQNLGVPGGPKFSARLPVGALAPGTYGLHLYANHEGETIASADDTLRIGDSPFAGQ